ncbi:MAG: tetratricopeptide repeat protein [Alphaproteobacteria bacterium]
MSKQGHRGPPGEAKGIAVPPDGDPRLLLARARERHRAGRTDLAEQLYRDVIAAWPGAAEPHRLLGILLAQGRRSRDAVDEFAAAARLAPANALYHNDLGHAYLAAERLADAVQAYRRALELRPDLAAAHFGLGNVFHRQGKLRDAAAAYRRAIAINPGLVPAHINLGITLQEAAEFGEAVAALRRATLLEPGLFAAHFNLGIVLAAQLRLDEAAVTYRTALAIDPQAAPAHLNLGTALQGQDKLDEAIVSFERAIALDPTLAQAHVNLGAVLYERGAFAPALAAIRRGLELEPDKALTYVNLAQTLQAEGDLAGADAAFRRALSIDPTLTTAKAHWSIALQQAGRWDEALALLDYPRFLRPRRLAEVEGWPSVAAFNADLAQYIYRHPTLMRDPPSKATQHGSQTMEVLNCSDPPVAALQRFIEESVREYHATALAPGRHPLAPVPPAAWRLHGWGVVLRASGYQTPHFHPEAVVSGVYYVQIPAVVKTRQDGEAGFIKFGPPIDGTPGAGAGDTPLTTSFQPEEGMIILFPSYFWHYTIPFESAEDRICVAFDVMPDERAVPPS